MEGAQKIETKTLNQHLISTPAVLLRPKLSIMSQIQRAFKLTWWIYLDMKNKLPTVEWMMKWVDNSSVFCRNCIENRDHLLFEYSFSRKDLDCNSETLSNIKSSYQLGWSWGLGVFCLKKECLGSDHYQIGLCCSREMPKSMQGRLELKRVSKFRLSRWSILFQKESMKKDSVWEVMFQPTLNKILIILILLKKKKINNFIQLYV